MKDITINEQVEVLKEVINELMITFENEEDRIDFILDIVSSYKKKVISKFNNATINNTYLS
jgi:predicted metal-binding protein